MNNEIQTLLAHSVKRTKRNFTIVSVILVALLAVMILAIFTDPTATTGVKVGVGILAVGLAWLIYKMIRMILKPNPIVDLLAHQPQKIKTVEVVAILSPKGHQTYQMNMFFRTTEGTTHVLSDHRKNILELLPLLEKELSHVQFVKKGF